MDSKEIIKGLYDYYYKTGCKYFSCNTNALWHEADFIAVTRSEYIIECEIKISRSDFKADFKKVEKHEAMAKGAGRVNYFYYACPEGLLTIEDLPPYAGLIYISRLEREGRSPKILAIIQKAAPRIHKMKIKPEQIIGLLRSVMFKYFTKTEFTTQINQTF